MQEKGCGLKKSGFWGQARTSNRHRSELGEGVWVAGREISESVSLDEKVGDRVMSGEQNNMFPRRLSSREGRYREAMAEDVCKRTTAVTEGRRPQFALYSEGRK